ncbi:3-deoxy-manno-octulosonate cytidylyltransferase [Pseudooceanicola sp. CBS1P-1]|uniref:3-deoxy-manno-octulosonate cytidylyltransferase n=1 Tax=Pseudooceanicola albus TaxID=2692189 RepID=A0A6L7GB92_9RHOB|nr:MULTISPECIES: manno-octulosonate cytidylyltransferase [Pseudooceanicola]MBT9386719.1 3-deoxy-manno-octulosonate cytidylyltransferase [Pseudooceanicola endophyticus]MXN20798.1 3-deoxy-manno-octulosonate cytidylyltransferase [Pseudooceanicola albus]
MDTVILIPARYASTRYPGKPLVVLEGADGPKSLIQRSWEAAKAVPEADAVFVCTDDARIAEAARAFGADVIMTDEACRNGTERCADALAKASLDPKLVVNLQGDAPLTPSWFLSELIAAMKADEGLDAATPVLRCDPETLEMFLEDRRNGRVGGTTAVFTVKNDALYFSKEVIPYTGGKTFAAGDVPVFHHVGVYAYRPRALAAYGSWPEGTLEKLEGLEQLRFLENGARLKCVEVEGRGRVFWELNNPEDVARIESILKKEA